MRELNTAVSGTIASLNPAGCRQWLEISIACSTAYLGGSDLRRLNVAAKALGLAYDYAAGSRDSSLRQSAQQAGSLLARGCTAMRHSVKAHQRDGAASVVDAVPPSAPVVRAARPTIAVLAGGRSKTFGLFMQLAGDLVALAEACSFTGETVAGASALYERAWSPPGSISLPDPPPLAPRVQAEGWDDVVSWLVALPAVEAVLLFGMPVVPGWVLAEAPAPVLNAHNGPLPTVRGLDALAWSLALGLPVAASAHEVVPAVDAGRVRIRTELDPHPLPTLAARLKHAQCTVLRDAVLGVTAPDNASSPGESRYFGRMHPVLRRTLDAALQPCRTELRAGT